MRVAIDGRYWRSRFMTGVERYLNLIVEALEASSRPLTVAVVATEAEARPLRQALAGHAEVMTVSDRRDSTMESVLQAWRPDVVHYPFDLPSRIWPCSVFTLHDAGRYLFPEMMVERVRNTQTARLRQGLESGRLKAVVTVSESSVRDIEFALGELPCELTSVPNFVPAAFRSLVDDARRVAGTKSKSDFLLAVGVYIPTKNLGRVCKAFRAAAEESPQTTPAELRLVGRIGWDRGFPMNGAKKIRVLGHVTDATLATLYAECAALIYGSLFEGFGLPIHEAILAGSRVICSDIPVFREIAGDAATYFDPYDVADIARCIEAVPSLPVPSSVQRDRILAEYSAAATGRALADVYDRAASLT